MKKGIIVDVSRAGSRAVGSEHGITESDLSEIQSQVTNAHTILQEERVNKKYGFWDLYKDDVVFDRIKAVATNFLERKPDNLVILGIGGSALGTKAIATAIKPPFYNLLSRARRSNKPRLFVMDNIDPTTFKSMLRLCPPEKTIYVAISKSGETAETMAQLMIIVDIVEKKLGPSAMKDHLVVITNPRGDKVKPSLLHPVADMYGLCEFTVPLNVGGRFSVFSPVGMFPAALLGMNLDGFREGCAEMDRLCATPELETNPAYLCAAYHYIADTKKGKSISVMMPYADGLADIADWYRQLWAESLGKRFSLDGREVYAGQTPVKALGATDQHSQIQLYREGPNDKIITILEVQRFDTTLRIPKSLGEIPELEYLRGATMNKLLAAELIGTIDALKISQRPLIRVKLPRIDENHVAQLLYMLEVQTAMAGRLYNVQTFDQPGVEEGKRIARRLMGAES